jgi:hypothetical protein
MQVKDISQKIPGNTENIPYAPKTVAKYNKTKDLDTNINPTASTAWQKDILMDAISNLENNVQMDNTHPLSKSINAPIESFREALVELSFIKTPKFLDEALAAQANVNPENVLALFVNQ